MMVKVKAKDDDNSSQGHNHIPEALPPVPISLVAFVGKVCLTFDPSKQSNWFPKESNRIELHFFGCLLNGVT